MREPAPTSWLVVAAGAGLQVLLLCAPLAFLDELGRTLVDVRVILLLGLLTVWCGAEARAQAVGPTVAAGEGPRAPLAGGVAVLVTLWAILASTPMNGAAPFAARDAAAALAVAAGIALRLAAIRALGRYFLDEIATLPRQPLVTGGIYGHVRHPSEAGTLLIVGGAAVLLRSVLGGAVMILVLLPVVLWRIRLEHRLLSRRYPEAFAAYSAAVPNLLPGRGLRAGALVRG